MREIRLSGSVEGVVSDHDSYSDSPFNRGAEGAKLCRLSVDYLPEKTGGAKLPGNSPGRGMVGDYLS